MPCVSVVTLVGYEINEDSSQFVTSLFLALEIDLWVAFDA